MAFPTEIQYIEAAEKALGVSLPSPWRHRLLSSNGGELFLAEEDWTVFPVFDTSDRRKASRTANHIVKENLSAREWRGFPPAAIAVAENGSGDYLVFLPLQSSPGVLDEMLHLWSHETAALSVVSQTTEGICWCQV
jgi:hypothetical protein